MHKNNGASGPNPIELLITALQSLQTAPEGAALLAHIESGQKIRDALTLLIERSFVAFVKNAVDRYGRTVEADPTTRLKIRMIDQRLKGLIETLGVRQPAPELQDAKTLEQHLIALLWAIRQPPARKDQPQNTTPSQNGEDKLRPLHDTLESQLDKIIYSNLDSIASLGSIEQTLRGVQPGELEEWREILRDASREIIEDYRSLGEDLQQARTCFKEISRQVTPVKPAYVAHAASGERHVLLHRLDAEMRRAQRYRLPLSVALLGPDHIDDIRRLVGPEAARQVLNYYLENLASCARAYDTVASCKPHKLVWVLPGAETDQGVSALRKAQERITTSHYHYAGRLRPLPTFSAAVVGYTPGEDSANLLARAEDLVVHAVRSGPNHIEWEKRRASAASSRLT